MGFCSDRLKNYPVKWADHRYNLGGDVRYSQTSTEAGIIDHHGHFYGCEEGQHKDLMCHMSHALYPNEDGDNVDALMLDWVLIYPEDAMTMHRGFLKPHEDGSDKKNTMMECNDDQRQMLERLGFDLQRANRKHVPEYDSVFSSDSPAFPERLCNARVVDDPNEVLEWMSQYSETYNISAVNVTAESLDL